uniref:Uncharacterized protein n=1 Tax=Myoviridae sp. ctplG2 TaxID=2826700 RepID=A0A8S5LW83_9CAUD|nr:MAG TPA: hypothetical protein [Myoviridae sp. ctplG2]
MTRIAPSRCDLTYNIKKVTPKSHLENSVKSRVARNRCESVTV